MVLWRNIPGCWLAGMAASAEYVPWAAFCKGVHAVMSRALISAPSSTKTSTVSMKPHPTIGDQSVNQQSLFTGQH